MRPLRPLNRTPPKMPVQAYKTYRIAAPLATHWRPATCAEAGCPHYLRGWKTVIDETTACGSTAIGRPCAWKRAGKSACGTCGATYIRRACGRRFVEERTGLGLTTFTFEAGQRCFGTQHKVPLEREALFFVRDGDWRGNPTGRVYQHTRPALWVEDSAEHLQRLADQLRRG